MAKTPQQMALENAAKEERVTKQSDVVDDEDEEAKNAASGEWNGPRGPEPTRFGDWERGGRCSDF